MQAAAFAFLLAGVLLNAAAQLLLKAGTNRLGVVTLAPDTFATTLTRIAAEGHVVGGLVLYGISVIVWIAGLSRVPVSVAYPMLSLGYVVNAVAAWYLFGEALSLQRLIGIGIILIGVLVLARS